MPLPVPVPDSLIPTAVVVPTAATVRVLTSLGALGAGPGAALQAGRALSVLQLAMCDHKDFGRADPNDDTPPLDEPARAGTLAFPTTLWPGLAIPAGPAPSIEPAAEGDTRPSLAQEFRGALVAGWVGLVLVALLAFAVATFVEAIFTARRRKKERRRAAEGIEPPPADDSLPPLIVRGAQRLKYPGVLLIALTLVIDGIVGAAAALVAEPHRVPGFDWAVPLLTFAVIGGLIIACLFLTLRVVPAHCHYTRRGGESGRGTEAEREHTEDAAAPAATGMLAEPLLEVSRTSDADESMSTAAPPATTATPTTKIGRVDALLRGRFAWRETSPLGQRLLRCTGPLFGKFRDGAAWFFAADLALAVAVSAVTGLRFLNEIPCIALVWVVASGTLIATLFAVWLRPYIAPLKAHLFTLVSVLTLLAAVLVACGVTMRHAQSKEQRIEDAKLRGGGTPATLVNAGSVVAMVAVVASTISTVLTAVRFAIDAFDTARQWSLKKRGQRRATVGGGTVVGLGAHRDVFAELMAEEHEALRDPDAAARRAFADLEAREMRARRVEGGGPDSDDDEEEGGVIVDRNRRPTMSRAMHDEIEAMLSGGAVGGNGGATGALPSAAYEPPVVPMPQSGLPCGGADPRVLGEDDVDWGDLLDATEAPPPGAAAADADDDDLDALLGAGAGPRAESSAAAAAVSGANPLGSANRRRADTVAVGGGSFAVLDPDYVVPAAVDLQGIVGRQ